MRNALLYLAGGLLLAITGAALFEARQTNQGMAALHAAVEERDMQGLQSISHEVETPSGPANITTTRNQNETLEAWLARHQEALEAAMGG